LKKNIKSTRRGSNLSITHNELVERSRRWLSSKGYPIVVTEIACVGEEPDALGFKNGYSTLIECKASRSDFLSDKKKVWRQIPEKALGYYRYYCAPKGLIAVSELPEGWGLLETSGKWLRQKVGSNGVRGKTDYRVEMYVLMSVIRRLGKIQWGDNALKGVSIQCYTYETKNRATVSIEVGEQLSLFEK
jgi:hypothetical protein